jgi:hypothetical protein
VAPLRLGGLRGKQSTPSVGWEVPVRSRRSASGSGTELKCGIASSVIRRRSQVRKCVCLFKNKRKIV